MNLQKTIEVLQNCRKQLTRGIYWNIIKSESLKRVSNKENKENLFF